MRKRTATASVDLVRVLLRFASGIGLDLGGFWEATGLDPQTLENGEARIPIEQFNAVWSQVALRAGDPNLGLHLGEVSSRLPSGGILSAVMMNCPTVGSAMEKLARYHALSTDFVRLRLSEEGEHATVSWEPVSSDVPLDRHHSEAVLCGLVLVLRRLTEDRMRLVEVRFTHPRPADTTEHRRILGCPVAFEQPRNELLIRRRDLALPVFMANPELLRRLERFAQEMLDRLVPPDTWADRVIQSLCRMLWRGEKPALGAVAYQLAIGPRQLQNKLREEETTYRALLDQLRQEIALEYLREPGETICDIAFLLGFSEQSAFNHAFKRWTGSTPQEYRRLELPSVSPG